MNTKIAIIISLIAGLSTLIGSFIILFIKRNSDKTIIISLAFSSSIMFFISIFDLIPESYNYIKLNNNITTTITLVIISIIIGITISFIIDKLIPEQQNNIKKIGILSFLTIIIHNIPEGMATFITTYDNLKLGISIAIAICLHNIPEGITISLPIYYSTNKKTKALLYSLIAALAEPLGAIITAIFLKKYINSNFIGILFSVIAGLMIYISILKLLTESFSYKKKILTIISFTLGILLFIIFSIIF